MLRGSSNKSADVRRMDIRLAFAATLRHLFSRGIVLIFRQISMRGGDGLRKNDGIFVGKMPPWLCCSVAYCRTIVPGRTSVGALTLVLGRLVESLSVTIFLLLASTGKVAT